MNDYDLNSDYGDLPAPYRTTKEDNGPSHIAVAIEGLQIGTYTDLEPDGQPGPDANYDDLYFDEDD